MGRHAGLGRHLKQLHRQPGHGNLCDQTIQNWHPNCPQYLSKQGQVSLWRQKADADMRRHHQAIVAV